MQGTAEDSGMTLDICPAPQGALQTYLSLLKAPSSCLRLSVPCPGVSSIAVHHLGPTFKLALVLQNLHLSCFQTGVAEQSMYLSFCNLCTKWKYRNH